MILKIDSAGLVGRRSCALGSYAILASFLAKILGLIGIFRPGDFTTLIALTIFSWEIGIVSSWSGDDCLIVGYTWVVMRGLEGM